MNTRRAPGAAAALTACIFLLAIAKSQTISEGPDLDLAKSLVVMIDGNLNSEPTQGAGIVFAVEDGWTYIATAYHLIRKGDARATNLKVRFWQSQSESFPAEHYNEASYDYDLAVLRVKTPKAEFDFNRLVDLNTLRKSQHVYAIGHPNGESPWNVTYLPGAITDIGTSRLKVESPSIKRGHSGGPLIDEQKMLVGMVLDTDGTTADILRIDRAAEILRRELSLTVVLSTGKGKDGLTYAWIPPGTFTMGCSGEKECDENEKPPHPVRISKGFWVGETEVTQEAYQRITGNNPSLFKGGKRPVESVSWQEAKAYCESLGLRLPTEAEWEYAARAESRSARYGDLDKVAVYMNLAFVDENSSFTHDVRGLAPNAWKLYDMLGNVSEWTADWYDEKYYGTGLVQDPTGPKEGKYRVLRGSSWWDRPQAVRVSRRRGFEPTGRSNDLGFRCAGEVR